MHSLHCSQIFTLSQTESTGKRWNSHNNCKNQSQLRGGRRHSDVSASFECCLPISSVSICAVEKKVQVFYFTFSLFYKQQLFHLQVEWSDNCELTYVSFQELELL